MPSKKVAYVTNTKVNDRYLIPSLIEQQGDECLIFQTKTLFRSADLSDLDLIICDRAQFLLTGSEIDAIGRQCFNIHPSFLPYNRGYNPNFWSFYDNTPCGVTIHNIDPSIDTGKIISQTLMTFSDSDTLESSYLKLRKISIDLFVETYPILRSGHALEMAYDNPSDLGTTHYKKDFNGMYELMPHGWQTSVGYVRRLKKDPTST